MQKCYIICGGPESIADVEFEEHSYIICADSGYDKALTNGISPDLIIGDFDSISQPFDIECEIIKAPVHKDDTDTMMAVRTAMEKGYTDITLVGATSGRADHTYANIQTLLYMHSKGVDSCIKGDETDMYVISDSTLTIVPQHERYLSVFSITESCTVSIDGAYYSVNDYIMDYTNPIGVSNEFTDRPCRISVQNGIAIIMTVKKQ